MHVRINGLSVSYTERGSGIPLLLIHGFPLNKEMWAPQIPELSGIARVLAPDLRGHGDTPPTPGPSTMSLLADDLNAFLDKLSIRESVVLCGLSMGGYIAFEYYRKFPQRIRGLILTATRAAPDTQEGRKGRDALAQQIEKSGMKSIVGDLALKLLAPQTAVNHPETVELIKQIMLRTSKIGAVNALMGMKLRSDSTPLLSEIKVPTLLVHGEHDQIVPIIEAKQLATEIPDSHITMIPNAGHLLNLEQPKRFNQTLIDFLEQL